MTTSKPAMPLDYGFSSDFEDLSTFPSQKSKERKLEQKEGDQKPFVKKPAVKNVVNKNRQAKADEVAKSHGFSSRESAPVLLKKRRRTHHDEPVDQLSIRGPVRILNDFIVFCDEKGLSYWEGLESLIHSSSKK